MNNAASPPPVRWIRARVPTEVHEKVRLIAWRLALSMPTIYTYILTRELWDVDPEDYVKKLAAESGLTIVNPLAERSDL